MYRLCHMCHVYHMYVYAVAVTVAVAVAVVLVLVLVLVLLALLVLLVLLVLVGARHCGWQWFAKGKAMVKGNPPRRRALDGDSPAVRGRIRAVDQGS